MVLNVAEKDLVVASSSITFDSKKVRLDQDDGKNTYCCHTKSINISSPRADTECSQKISHSHINAISPRVTGYPANLGGLGLPIAGNPLTILDSPSKFGG